MPIVQCFTSVCSVEHIMSLCALCGCKHFMHRGSLYNNFYDIIKKMISLYIKSLELNFYYSSFCSFRLSFLSFLTSFLSRPSLLKLSLCKIISNIFFHPFSIKTFYPIISLFRKYSYTKVFPSFLNFAFLILRTLNFFPDLIIYN